MRHLLHMHMHVHVHVDMSHACYSFICRSRWRINRSVAGDMREIFEIGARAEAEVWGCRVGE